MRAQPTWEDLPLREEIRASRPYGAPQLDLPVCLNVNENPYPPPEDVQRDMVEAVRSTLGRMNRYPDREARVLRAKLAGYVGHGITSDQVWAANGSNEIMIQILLAFAGPGRAVLNFTPSYSMYPEYARNSHSDYITVARNADFRIDQATARQAIAELHPHVIVIGNPNNPTGTVVGLDIIEEILQFSSAMVVVDEAYQEFSAAPSALSLVGRYGNLIVSRTMSKAFAFAGGRLGYAVAAPAVVDALRVVRLPYHLSGSTQAIAAAALDHADEMLAQVDHLIGLREQAITTLRAQGLTVVDSQSNFFLFGPFATRHRAWQRLVDQGVLVRETGPEHFLRACVGTTQEMDIFYRAVAAIWPQERQPE